MRERIMNRKKDKMWMQVEPEIPGEREGGRRKEDRRERWKCKKHQYKRRRCGNETVSGTVSHKQPVLKAADKHEHLFMNNTGV